MDDEASHGQMKWTALVILEMPQVHKMGLTLQVLTPELETRRWKLGGVDNIGNEGTKPGCC